MALGGMNVEQYVRDPARKQQFVTPMFDIIASRYDQFTRVFSFGMDRQWKAELLDELRPFVFPAANVLDLACGTGDLAFALGRLAPSGHVQGIDASPRMIEAANTRLTHVASPRVAFSVGDMMALDVPDASVDIVTAGYALRNVPDHVHALCEIARVLKPGGRLYTLDFYRPTAIVWRQLFVGYLAAAGNLVGWLWHREPVVYGYIAHSVDQFVSIEGFSAAVAEAGLIVEHVRPKLLGGIAIHHARRPA